MERENFNAKGLIMGFARRSQFPEAKWWFEQMHQAVNEAPDRVETETCHPPTSSNRSGLSGKEIPFTGNRVDRSVPPEHN